MGFEGEFASYEPLRRIISNEKLEAMRKRMKVREHRHENPTSYLPLVSKTDLHQSDFLPDLVLSNQMRMTKVMGMNYSVQWWKLHGFTQPPKIEPLDFLRKKIEWRYEKGLPHLPSKGKMIFGDSTKVLQTIKGGFDLFLRLLLIVVSQIITPINGCVCGCSVNLQTKRSLRKKTATDLLTKRIIVLYSIPSLGIVRS